MNMYFICSFIATSRQLYKGTHPELFAKKSKSSKSFDHLDQNGPPPFRIMKGNTLQIKIAGDNSIRGPGDVLRKITEVMTEENADKILNDRPLRHYPRHHYKRLIKQKKGFQMSDARREAFFAEHMEIPVQDDISFLEDKHVPKVNEAVDYFDQWLSKSKERTVASGSSDHKSDK